MNLVHKSEVHEWVGENVAYERGRFGWSQAVLAEKLSKSLGRPFDQATVARLEKGRRPVDVLELRELGRLFDCSPGALMDFPQRLRWRGTVEIWRRRADDALAQIAAAAANFYEAASSEVDVVEALARELDQPLLLLEVGRPDPSRPLCIVLEQLLARRPGDQKAGRTAARRESQRQAEAAQLIAPVLEGLDWS